MATRVVIDGLEEVTRAIKALGPGYDDVLKAAQAELARTVVERARPNVPTRSGRLKGSLRHSGTKTAAVGRVGSASVPYAPIVHWKYGPPFLVDAAEGVDAEAEARQVQMVIELIARWFG